MRAANALPLTGRRHQYSLALIGTMVLGVLILVALLAGVLSPNNPRAISGRPVSAPSPNHPLGTNDLGQDLLSIWLHGARISLTVGFLVAVLSTLVSGTAGVLSVLWRPAQGSVLALIDMLLAIPHLPLLVLVVALLGPGLWHVIGALTLLGWPAYARVVRSQVMTTMQRDYVDAARALGASSARIVRTCMLPDILPLLWTKFLLTVRWAILMEATLALLGLGDLGQISWGMMLNTAFVYPLLFVGDSWLWWALPPALSIAAITLALAVIGQDFETWLNPATSVDRRLL